MTDFAAEADYAHDILADHFAAAFDTPPERDLTTVRGAAAWGLEQARIERDWAEPRLASWASPELASRTFRRAVLDCAGMAAAMVTDGNAAYGVTWARAYRHLLDLVDRADRARVSRAGGAT